MQATLSVTLPFFALVFCGFLAARQRVLPEAAIPGLNAYVLYFALPCMLFRFGASMPFGKLIAPALVGIYAVCALLVVGLTVWMTRRRVGLKNAAFGALVAAFPNSGFMGVPLLVALYGNAAAGPVIGTLLVDLFLTSTLCLALAHVHEGARPKGIHNGRADASLRKDDHADSSARAAAEASDSTLASIVRSLRAALLISGGRGREQSCHLIIQSRLNGQIRCSFGVFPGKKDIAHQQGEAVHDDHGGWRRGLGQIGGQPFAHLARCFQGLPMIRAFGAVTGDALGHFFVTGLRCRHEEHSVVTGQLARQFECVIALATTRPAKDEGQMGNRGHTE